ncbi:MAG TPA: rRNA maturation RNase YbeY [Candidatus Paceibacterota bacterium]|nr:rRNA maturation RNase YbeY [Candidatus Paceibacterota bacterium]
MRFANKIESIKNEILGIDYSLSVAFVDVHKSREINKKYRKKNRATNVLSFSLRQGFGELVLCPNVIKIEAENFNKTYSEWLGQLVIHGMLHLKGMKHSSTMEVAENFYWEKYDKEHNGWNRRRVLVDEGHSRRVHKRRKKS